MFFFCLRVLFVVCCFAGCLISVPDGCLLTDEHSPGGLADSASSHSRPQMLHLSSKKPDCVTFFE